MMKLEDTANIDYKGVKGFYETLYKKKDIELLTELKTEIDSAFTFFCSLYADNYAETKVNINLALTTGYNYLIKIKSYLSLLIIKDSNQTNKYSYEDCLNKGGIIFILASYIESLTSIIKNENNTKIDLVIDISKVAKNIETLNSSNLNENIETYYNEKINFIKHEAVLHYANLLNHIILGIETARQILKNVHINENGW